MSSPQSGVIGFLEDRILLNKVYPYVKRAWAPIELCLNRVQSIAIFGGQDSGKTNTVLATVEMATRKIPNICDTQMELALIYCHYHTDATFYPPGIAKAGAPKSEARSVQMLKERLNATPVGMGGRRMVYVPQLDETLMAQRRKEFSDMEVRTIRIPLADLDGEKLKLLMGASKNASLYLMKLSRIIDELMMSLPAGQTMTWEMLIEAVDHARFTPRVREILDERLRQVKRFIGDGPSMATTLKPGDTAVIDMRAPWVDEVQAMVMFTILMDIFSKATVTQVNARGETEEVLFYKVIVFDEAHKYMGKCGILSEKIEKMVREMRHRRMWVITASQDPESVPKGIVKFATVVIMHRTQSKKSLKWVQDLCAGWAGVGVEQLAALEQGECYLRAIECADPLFRTDAVRMRIRASCAMPGGTTYAAVHEDDVQR